VALCTELQIALATLRDDLASSKQDSAVQVQSALTTLRTEMKSIKQDVAANMVMHKEINTTVNTAIQDALATLRAELRADIVRMEQSLRTEPAGPYAFQGNMVTTLNDLHINEASTVETGATMESGAMVTEGHVELAEGDVIAIQLATTNAYLRVEHANTTMPIDHFVWKEVD
jgi:molybdopterin converting factor small subunit